jgi:hypothetical protein
MTSSNTLTVQLKNMPTSDYNGISVCKYADLGLCDTDFIVGTGGISYTITDDKYTTATIDLDPSVLETAVALGIYPLNTSDNYVGLPGSADHKTITLTTNPFTVTGMSIDGDNIVVSVGGYTLVNQNAYYCFLEGTPEFAFTKIKYDEGFTTSTSCAFPISEIERIRNIDTTFNLWIIDFFDSEVVRTQDYNFSDFLPEPTPTPIPSPTPTETPSPTPTPTPMPQITSLSPAKVWVGLKNSDDVGIKFDLKAEVYINTTLIGSGELNTVLAGSSGFNNAKLDSIPLTLFSPVTVTPGDQFSTKVYVRNACVGSGHNSGTARLWYIDTTPYAHYLLNGFMLGTSPGSGPKKTIDVAAGAKCSAFKSFGTWVTTL